MKRQKVGLLVPGVHGVVFNSPFCEFLDRLATKTGQTPVEVRDRWHRELRLPAWTASFVKRNYGMTDSASNRFRSLRSRREVNSEYVHCYT